MSSNYNRSRIAVLLMFIVPFTVAASQNDDYTCEFNRGLRAVDLILSVSIPLDNIYYYTLVHLFSVSSKLNLKTFLNS